MTTHGHWHGDEPHRPIVYATFYHPQGGAAATLDFLIDTGADQTFIVPDHQRLLKLPKKFGGFRTKPVHTLGGIYKFNYLTNCTLAFTDQDGQNHEISNITAYFALQRDGFFRKVFGFTRRNLVGEGQFPSILGRDVLRKLCLGFCKQKDLLFTSRKIDEYHEALKKDFSKRPSRPKWFGTDFDIGDYEIKDY